ATITSPALMSAMRITPSSITRDSALMMSLSSASARVSMSSSLESGPGCRNCASFCRNPRLSGGRRLRCGPLLGGWSATGEGVGCNSGQGYPMGLWRTSRAAAAAPASAAHALAGVAHALADFLQHADEAPELLGLGLEVVVGDG